MAVKVLHVVNVCKLRAVAVWILTSYSGCDCYLQLVDLLVISYALVLLFHPEYTLTRYPDLYESKKHSDVVQSSTVETDRAVTSPAVNLTSGFISNVTSTLRSVCWSNCGVLLHLCMISLWHDMIQCELIAEHNNNSVYADCIKQYNGVL